MVKQLLAKANAYAFVVLLLGSRFVGLAQAEQPFAVGQDDKQQPSPAEIEAPDVFKRVTLVRHELQRLQFIMGRPPNTQSEMQVEGAAPRDAYFQALTLYRKADRLAFEHTRVRVAEPPLPHKDIRSTDVYRVVDAALKRIRAVQAKLGMKEADPIVKRDASKTSSDVFQSIVQANRQLNLLLERQFAPGDVFEQATLAVSYTSRLLEQFPDAVTIPEEPPYEEGKRPSNVYRRFISCLERIRSIEQRTGLTMLELKIGEESIANASPSDVYDIASLVISEVADLHARLPDARPPRKVYYPGRKFPSDVYQRVGILERQLIELERWVKTQPDWLKRNRAAP